MATVNGWFYKHEDENWNGRALEASLGHTAYTPIDDGL